MKGIVMKLNDIQLKMEVVDGFWVLSDFSEGAMVINKTKTNDQSALQVNGVFIGPKYNKVFDEKGNKRYVKTPEYAAFKARKLQKKSSDYARRREWAIKGWEGRRKKEKGKYDGLVKLNQLDNFPKETE